MAGHWRCCSVGQLHVLSSSISCLFQNAILTGWAWGAQERLYIGGIRCSLNRKIPRFIEIGREKGIHRDEDYLNIILSMLLQ